MAWELRDMSGSLFRNENKEGVESRADYKGEVMIDGTVYWISAWIKEGKRGKFMSLGFKEKAAKAPEVMPKNPGTIADMDDDLPFN
jgi:hypothetical protein